MKKNPTTIAYWITTALAAFALFAGGAQGLFNTEALAAGNTSLGYPLYFYYILSTWKLLAAITLLVPGLPRLKEWAYAGVTFTMTGAFFSHIAAGDPFGRAIPPLVVLTFALVSWALRPKSRKLAAS